MTLLSLKASTVNKLTNRMRPNGIRNDSKQGNRNERAITSQPQNRISELKSGVVLVGIALVEVDVCTLSSALHEK